MFSLTDLHRAADLVHRHIAPSPAIHWPLLSQRTGTQVVVKHENHLPTGAFKVRGGIVYADGAAQESQGSTPRTGLISATRGNSQEKNAAMAALGARLVEHGADFEEARKAANRLAQAENLTFVPSFAPPLVLGVATYALELFLAEPDLDAVYVPIGLGSGICGTILARDLLGRRTRVIGVQSSGADPYARSFAAGSLVQCNRADTRADGIAVRQPDAEALAIILRGCDRVITVPDAAIAAAIAAYWTDTHNLIEGAGAAPLAGLIQEQQAMAGKRVALIASGGNIDRQLFADWVGN